MKLPFQNLNWNAWVRLALTALFTFYAAIFGYELFHSGLFQPMGFDFLAFWSAGKQAATAGFGAIYQMDQLAAIQYQALNPGVPFSEYQPVPVPLFSFFVIPFALLSHMNPVSGYWVWTIINSFALVGYLIFFINWLKQNGKFPILLVLLALGSYATNQNIFWGQVEVWLMIMTGEFIRACLQKKPFLAGIWLGGLLLKPQVLILILPWLLLVRAWDVIKGFSVSGFIILLVSFLLGGVKGFIGLLNLWLKYVPGMHSNAPENMINWRMLALHLNGITSSSFGWVVAGLGMLVTLYLCWKLLPPKQEGDSSRKMLFRITGVLAASLIITWHSHMHLSMVLFPFLILAWNRQYLSQKLITIWMILPALLQILVLIVAFMMMFNILPIIPGFGGFILGMSGLVMNLIILLQLVKARNLPLGETA